ncbi:helix-turn-helix domain-containing protein [Nodularia sp. NIES-3585]|uniref:helix-turn-helix domain-containing protein n=1 Tax=Nodularia sp. NIES-3585 TaxID=1973477 RepID=UPI000B5CDCC2|nr:helix-turn-helix transcriptional regulator [Nodularia sp. NIES-3585]GAX34114.1 hypothetical protein NIES3585_01130 [Nodularia sp. NIES-3585]
MNMTPVYLFTIAGNPSIKISQDELRSLLGKIEDELHSSKVYLRAVATLQKLLGASGEQVNILLKAVGREAISLAFQQFAQPEKVTEANHFEPNTASDLPNIKVARQSTNADINKGDVSPKATVNSQKNLEINSPGAALINWLKPNKKSSPSELAQPTLAEQRREIMCRIGEQLKQSRESQGISLCQLNIYTHIPIYRMEAIENSNFDLLPEDTLLRRFIRVMGNTLGLNGTTLAASLPATDALPIIPSWYNTPKSSGGLGVDIRPIHLYVGYTALVAGAVGGLSLTTQQTKTGRVMNPDIVNSPSSSVSPLSQKAELNVKPGLKSNGVGSDIAPPETF